MSKRIVVGALVVGSLAALSSVVSARAAGLQLAQAGSLGGTIGKQDKSVSGEEVAPRSAARSRRPVPQRAGGDYSGTWMVQSTGQNCAINTSAAVIIEGRRVIAQGGTGTVSASGAVTTVGSAGAISFTGRGQLSGQTGSGTFRQSDGCAGRWVAVKQ